MADDEYIKLYRATAPKTSPQAAAEDLIDSYRNYRPPSAQMDSGSSGIGYLLEKAGIDPSQIKQHLMAGLMQKPGFEPQSGILNKAAYYGGQYAPPAVGATLGTMAAGPEAAPLGAALGAGAGAAMGRSIQNFGQAISSQVSPGSAAQKTPGQLIAEPTTDALTNAMFQGLMAKAGQAIKAPAAEYISSETGVKQNLAKRALEHLDAVFGSPSVQKAGENLGAMAEKAGIKTGTEGYKIATGSILGREAASDEMSSATTLAMAKVLRDPAALEAATPQELYSTAEGLRKAMAAPKYADPHGPMSQNFRMYATQLAHIEDRLETVIPGYAQGRLGYANALAKEQFDSWGPLNKNGTISQLKMLAGIPMAATGAAKASQGDFMEGGALLLSAAMLSPLIAGKAIQYGAKVVSTQIPQTLARMGVSAGSNTLTNALGQNTKGQ